MFDTLIRDGPFDRADPVDRAEPDGRAVWADPDGRRAGRAKRDDPDDRAVRAVRAGPTDRDDPFADTLGILRSNRLLKLYLFRS